MSPERIPADSIIHEGLDKDLIERISRGELFVCPTETIYGLGSVFKEGQEKRISEVKRRKPGHPFLLVGGSIEHFRLIGIEWNPQAERLAKEFWPGPLTIVIGCRNGEEQGIRVSDNPVISVLSNAVEAPLFSTSANLSGEEYRNDPDYIFSVFKDGISFMIDAGFLPESRPSTVVRVGNNGVELLREGAILYSDITKVLN